jgi:branched-chain amino acid transport system permease protein
MRINSKLYILLVPIFLFLVIYPLIIESPVYVDIFIMFCLMAGLGGAWSIIGGYGGQFSIGHAGFFGIGAYTSTLLYLRCGLTPWVGMLIGGGLAAVVSFLVFYPCFRLRGIFFTMASLAFAEILLIISIYWVSLTKGNVGLLILFKPGFAHLMFSEKIYYAYIALLYMGFVFVVSVVVKETKLGSNLIGVREDEDAAESLGVGSARCKSYAMMISAFLAALGGTIYAQYVQFIDPDTLFDVAISVRFALLAIIGGMGTAIGPIIGSAILTPLDTMLRGWLGGAYAGLGFLTYGIVLIACVLALPEGVMKWVRDNIYPLVEKLPDIVLFGRRGEEPRAEVPAVRTAPGHVDVDELLIEIEGVTKAFGGLKALDDVSITIHRGEIVGLIGPNGAGKTTLFNVISGFHRSDGGRITFKNEDITNLAPPHRICMRGLARTFQLVKPFAHITVFDNVVVGSWLKSKSLRSVRQKTGEILHFVGLEKYRDYQASSLTIADRKRLELARALATDPELLLLDEVMAGLNPTETEEIISLVRRISSEMNITLFIIEHVMRAVMELSKRIIVLDYGQKIAEGRPEEIAKDESVIKAYLGEEYLYHAAGSGN